MAKTCLVTKAVCASLCLLLIASAAPAASAPPAVFVDVAQQAGITDILKGAYAHAAAWGDVNGDGYPDLFWGSFGHKEGPDRLLINQKDGTFKESAQKAINREDGRASGAVFVDLDDDGALDLIIVNNYRTDNPGGVELLKNDGKGNFTDVTAGSGMDGPEISVISGRSPFILDYDGDGKLDVLVQGDMWGGKSKRSFLMHNDGKMKLSDATAKAGLPVDETFLGIGGAVGDVNGDGRPDILNVGGLKQGKQMLHNIRLFFNAGQGKFRESKNFDFNATFPSFGNDEDWVCGAAIGDLNNDGRMDLVIGVHYGSSVSKDGNPKPMSVRAYLNMGMTPSGDVNWKDITEAAGLTALCIKQPHVEIQDFNNDGKMDIWNGAIMKAKQGGQMMPYVQYNQGLAAAGVPKFLPPPGLSDPKTFEGYTPDHQAMINPKYAAASPTADYDNDGRLDIFAADWATPPVNNHSFLFHNVTEPVGEWITVKVDQGQGAKNRFGIGAKVSVYKAGQAGDAKALLGDALIEINNGYCSGRPATAHFGVPGQDKVDVVVQLPNGGPALKAAGAATKQVLVVK